MEVERHPLGPLQWFYNMHVRVLIAATGRCRKALSKLEDFVVRV